MDTFPTTAACNDDDVLSDTKRAAAQRGTNHTSPQLCVCVCAETGEIDFRFSGRFYHTTLSRVQTARVVYDTATLSVRPMSLVYYFLGHSVDTIRADLITDKTHISVESVDNYNV